MLRMVQDGRARRGVFQAFAVALLACCARSAYAQTFETRPLAPARQPHREAPPRSLMEPPAAPPRAPAPAPMTLLVEPPASKVAAAAPAVPEAGSDRVDGPAIDALAAGRSAVTVSTVPLPGNLPHQ